MSVSRTYPRRTAARISEDSGTALLPWICHGADYPMCRLRAASSIPRQASNLERAIRQVTPDIWLRGSSPVARKTPTPAAPASMVIETASSVATAPRFRRCLRRAAYTPAAPRTLDPEVAGFRAPWPR